MIHGLDYVIDMLGFACLVLPFVLLLRLVICKIKKEKTTWTHELVVIFFMLYILAVLSQTIQLPMILQYGFIFHVNTNLIPFYTINSMLNYGSDYSIAINIIGNIIIFVPFGFLCPLIFKSINSLLKIILLGFLFSLCIELLQMFSFRVTDIDDLILNTLGALVGYAIYKLLKIAINLFIKKAP